MAVLSLDLKPSRRMLRNFGLIGLGVFPALALLSHTQQGIMGFDIPAAALKPLIGVLIGMGIYCGVFAAAGPRLLYPLYMLMTVAFYPIGFAVSYVVVAVMYYFVLTPVGIVFKIIGRDAMSRKFDSTLDTYWIRRSRSNNIKRYFRQY